MNRLVRTFSIVLMILSTAGIAEAAGNAEAGKTKAALCAGCHGADGNSMIPSFPKLAGQNERYFIKQINDIKSGSRDVVAMAAIVGGLSDQDVADIGAYFASQTIKVGTVKADQFELGQKIYRAGNAASGVTACSACHGATGEGLPAAGYPSLGGQHTAYLEAQLKAFRAAGRADEAGVRRSNDGEGKMMQSVAGRLSDAELKAVASYINGLQ
ncbi:cytochrome c4 [Gammaproteobacteria bacterium 45_16_T64]|nr:cytochrome c4 [Gammaproteobacteria bacterium 45_16_T64]